MIVIACLTIEESSTKIFNIFSQLQKQQRIYGTAMGMNLELIIQDFSKHFHILIKMSARLLRRH